MKHDILRTPYLGTDSLRTDYTDEDQSKSQVFSESRFFAITYPSEDQAARVIKTLQRIQSAKLIDLEDAVYVTKNTQGRVKLHQARHTTKKGVVGGTLVGLVVGSILLTPIGGAAIGAASGALAAKTSDVGLEDQFIKELSEAMQPNSSAIFLLVRSISRDEVLAELAPYGGQVLQTSLSPEMQEKLQEVLDQGRMKADG
jgi:uncharacterized membrane protein